ncbi:MAG: type II toxin-antitoxin system HicA family toxin [Betaproteobacteria bacterium]|nr:type II toxin-antitoxin system HicA family toxin [Betaproteobacteria bacterium]
MGSNNFTPALKALLRQHGCYFKREGKGDHEIWFSPTTNVSFPVDRHIRSRHTANAVLKQAGIDKSF